MEIKTIERNDYTLRILTDDHPHSPAEWATLGQIAYTSDRYTLGTEHVSQERAQEIGEKIESGEYIGLPVYAYVHSGATISTRRFSCPWDSGQSGFVYCNADDPSIGSGDNALSILRGEVKTFDQYLRGDVYGYTITDKNGDVVDSCWGFYGIECAEEEALSALNYWVTQQGELFTA